VGREYPNDPSPERVLRVGYVSGDLRNHPVGRFLSPILAGHDRSAVRSYCYSHARKPDAYTERLRGLADAWRETLGLDCDQIADLVRRDGIDVLVDLAGHLANHRLLAFAKRPTPVQVSFLGYPDTTGMRGSIRYRITDAVHDPPGRTEQWHTEELVRLPRCCWAYDAGDAPDVNELPALSSGHVTFGSLNRLVKVTPAMVRLWGRILGRVPGSRLLVLIDPGCVHDADLQQKFRAGGVDPARMIACPSRPRPDYLRLFHQVDVCLDTFPYNGHTTTLDGMWMGVPTVSLTGRTHVQRAGLSVLSAAGLAELACPTEDAYVETVVGLANDLPRLADLRRTLRPRMAASPLCDGAGLARALEAAYRAMWRAWCGEAAGGAR
jgi:predicted O-linked N-acetylglucosamine transferase (SPINDLY family)